MSAQYSGSSSRFASGCFTVRDRSDDPWLSSCRRRLPTSPRSSRRSGHTIWMPSLFHDARSGDPTSYVMFVGGVTRGFDYLGYRSPAIPRRGHKNWQRTAHLHAWWRRPWRSRIFTWLSVCESGRKPASGYARDDPPLRDVASGNGVFAGDPSARTHARCRNRGLQ